MQRATVDDLVVNYVTSNPDLLAKADARARHLLDKFGCFLARRLFGNTELEPIRRDLRCLISLRRQMAGLGLPPPSDREPRFDDGILALAQQRAADTLIIQEAFNLLLSARQVAGHPILEHLSQELMGTQVIGHSDFTDNADIRLPDQEPSVLSWHQDNSHALDLEDRLTYWIPLHDCGEREGSLWLALGSHKLGSLSMRSPPIYELSEPSIVDRFQHLQIPMQAGDVLVFSALLVQAEGHNCSGRARWSLHVRHSNLESPRAVARGWPAGRSPT